MPSTVGDWQQIEQAARARARECAQTAEDYAGRRQPVAAREWLEAETAALKAAEVAQRGRLDQEAAHIERQRA
jgi:hypothetical protein